MYQWTTLKKYYIFSVYYDPFHTTFMYILQFNKPDFEQLTILIIPHVS